MHPDYQMACLGLYLVLITLLLQSLVASVSKATKPDAVPGKIDESLSHGSFIFRSHRTFMNSLENMPLFLGTVLLAFMVGTDPAWTATLVWIFALARIAHMLLYYAIATERNPSPRSYFFGIGLLANIVLLAVIWLV